MSNYGSNGQGAQRRDNMKPAGRLASLFGKGGNRSQSEPNGPSSIRRVQDKLSPNPNRVPELMPQGKALHLVKGKPPVVQGSGKTDISKLAYNNNDERYQYLLKKAIIRRIEDEDKIIYAELPGIPGVLVVYREPNERNANPERLNLDRRELGQLPLLEAEERLRLLNFQHNHITKIENLLSLPNLIFLDLYNNQIKEIQNLHTVPTLRVLMLGKNQIDKIKNLNNLTRLDVLDLHSNRIAKIENLAHLTELRVLNLANNLLSIVDSLENLASLNELNLRRNQITAVRSLNRLQKLQRVFLSNNLIDKFESIDFISSCQSLTELAFDGNPIFLQEGYMSTVLNACQNLKHLDLKKVTNEDREQTAPPPPPVQNIPPPPEPEVRQESDQDLASEKLIQVIQREWALEIQRLQQRGTNQVRRRKEMPGESLVQSGHAEIEDDRLLFIYGNAIEVLAKQEFQQTVEEILFQYVRFDYLAQHSCINKLRKFANLRKIILIDNNLHSFIQLSKLECLPALTSITVQNNDVSYSTLLRSFIVYRFPQIREVNDEVVTIEDKNNARQQFQNFDKILCNVSILVSSRQKPDIDPEDRDKQKNFRNQSKKNVEFAGGYASGLLSHCTAVEAKMKALSNNWDELVKNAVSGTVKELSGFYASRDYVSL